MIVKMPESLESRFRSAEKLAKQSKDRSLFDMGLAGVGLAGFFADFYYVNQKYFQYINLAEEIQKGEVDPNLMSPLGQEAVMASMGMVGFMAFTGVCIIAALYRGYQFSRHFGEGTRLMREMEKESKRPPRLRP